MSAKRIASIAILLVVAAHACAESVIVRNARIGDLVKLTATDSVGWDVESGSVGIPFEVNEEQTACYLGTGPVSRSFVVKAIGIKTLKNGKTVPSVAQRYVINVVAGDAPVPSPPGPTPAPPTPSPTPADIPNEMGIGLAVYRAAVTVGDKPACVAAASSFENVAAGLERSNGSEAAIDAAKTVLQKSVGSALAGDRWASARKAIAAALTSAEQAAGGWNYQDQAKSMREAGAALRIAGR